MLTKARTVHPSNNNQAGDNMATQNQQNWGKPNICLAADKNSYYYNYYYLFLSGVRIWNKILLTLHEQRKDPFQHKLHKLLVKVLETGKVYVDMNECHYQFLSELLILFKCPPSLNS